MKIDFNKKHFKVLLFTGFAGWTEILHGLSLRLKKDYPHIKLVAYCLGVHNKNFLIKQNDLNYESVYCSDEMRLGYWGKKHSKRRVEELEKKYGDPFLTKLFYTDRRLVTHSHPDFYDHDPSHEEILNVFEATFNDIESIVEDCDLAIAYCGASSESQVLYSVCKKKGIPFLSFIHGRVGPFYNLQKTARDKNHILENEWKEAFFNNKPSSKEAIEWYEKCYNDLLNKSKTSVPYVDNMNYYVDSKRITLHNILKSFKNLIKKRVIQNDNISRYTQVKKNILFKTKEYSSKKFLSNKSPESKFVLYPLHLEPEASTLVFGGKNYDTIGTIKRIAYFLPATWKLAVKEHSVMRGKRPKSFYEEISNIYNVELISPKVNSMTMMKKSEALIINTSTMGLEAAIIGLRVICLGSPFFSYIPSIYKPQSFDEIEKILSDEWDNEAKDRCVKEMRKLVEVMYDISFKDPEKVLWNSKPEINQKNALLDKIYKQFFSDLKKLYNF